MTTKTPTPTTVEIDGAAMRERRILAGLEIKTLAEKVGVDRSYISALETGRRTRVSPSLFAALVAALGVERDELRATATAQLAS